MQAEFTVPLAAQSRSPVRCSQRRWSQRETPASCHICPTRSKHGSTCSRDFRRNYADLDNQQSDACAKIQPSSASCLANEMQPRVSTAAEILSALSESPRGCSSKFPTLGGGEVSP